MLLDPDPYFYWLGLNHNTLIQNSLGTIDSTGKAQATLVIPPQWKFAKNGMVFTHACAIIHPTKLKVIKTSTTRKLTITR